MLILLLSLICLNPSSRVFIHDKVDTIEIDYVYDEADVLRLSFISFWEINSEDGLYHIIDWRLLKTESMYPTYDYKAKKWICTFYDSKTNIFRRIIADSYEEYKANYDIEVFDRSFFRRGLRNGK